MNHLSAIGLYAVAALAEIGGCFAFWAWLKLDKTAWWLVPGMACLAVFALLLTRVDASFAGRAYAAYGGVYIVASVVWLRLAEGQTPTRWDLIGAAVSVVGTLIIILAPRGENGGV